MGEKKSKDNLLVFLEPGTAPRKVQARPLSSSTMVIQWVEPETPNGQVTVSFRKLYPSFESISESFFAFCRGAGLQDILHDGSESTDGLLEVSDGGQQSTDHDLGSGHPHDIHDSSAGVDKRRSRSIEHTCPD